MAFDKLRKAQKDNLEVVAHLVVPRGKRRFLIRSTLIGGTVFWLVMNAMFLMRDQLSQTGRYLAPVEAVGLLLSMLVGFMMALRMWRLLKRFEKT